MRIVLRTDIDKVGKRGDIVDVADGYARNFLLPKGHAILATNGVTAQASAMRRARDLKDAKDRESAEVVARTLVPMVIRIPARSGSGRKAVRFGHLRRRRRRRGPAGQGHPRPPASASRRAHQVARDPRGAGEAARRRGVPGDRGGRPQLATGDAAGRPAPTSPGPGSSRSVAPVAHATRARTSQVPPLSHARASAARPAAPSTARVGFAGTRCLTSPTAARSTAACPLPPSPARHLPTTRLQDALAVAGQLAVSPSHREHMFGWWIAARHPGACFSPVPGRLSTRNPERKGSGCPQAPAS